MHAYYHIPFCTGRCHYCAFLSGPPPAHPETYVDELLREAEARPLSFQPLTTLYCGGGTPALLGEKGFRRLKAAGLCTLAPDGEWSVELHPATVTQALVETLAELGVTRLSLGVQAFSDATLQRCNRRHSVRQALDAIALARQWIPDTGIDLIAGLPGVTEVEWRATIQQALALDLPHLSIYGLSIDEGSAWAREGVSPPDPDALCDALAWTAETLAAAGLQRYETSNYAREGFCCRHNLNTWQGGDYVGLGRGAVSRIGLQRRYGDGREETLSPLEDALERALTELRLAFGFNLESIVTRYPLLLPFKERWTKVLAMAHREGLLTAAFAPTPRGYEVLDALERTLLETLVE